MEKRGNPTVVTPYSLLSCGVCDDGGMTGMVLAGTKPFDPSASRRVRIYNVHGKLYDFDMQAGDILEVTKYILLLEVSGFFFLFPFFSSFFFRVTMHTSKINLVYVVLCRYYVHRTEYICTDCTPQVIGEI